MSQTTTSQQGTSRKWTATAGTRPTRVAGDAPQAETESATGTAARPTPDPVKEAKRRLVEALKRGDQVSYRLVRKMCLASLEGFDAFTARWRAAERTAFKACLDWLIEGRMAYAAQAELGRPQSRDVDRAFLDVLTWNVAAKLRG